MTGDRLVFDIESDGLLDTVSKIHCLVIKNLTTGTLHTFTQGDAEVGVAMLTNAAEIVGHNIINYDLPALKILFPDFEFKGLVTDTLVMSRLIKADLYTDDFAKCWSLDALPKNKYGSHSLGAWGLRLGFPKGDYSGGWEAYSQEMMDYCIRDVEVTEKLLTALEAQRFSPESIKLEHELAEICFRIGNNGWTFDIKAAGKLYATLAKRRMEIETELQVLFEPWEINEVFIPKSNNKTRGYVKGEPFNKVTVVNFNPNSRGHIQLCLIKKYEWKPKEWTPSGEAKIDEEILNSLPYPEAKKLAESFMIAKRIGMLAEGNAAWLKLVNDDGRIRHSLISGGTISGRASCRSPNLQQVPAARSAYGKECRELFTVPDGWTICGSDLSGIELRVLAHFLDDGGEYATQILEGDIHTYNQKMAGLETRDLAKKWVYSMIYGGGDRLIGEILGGGPKEGKRSKDQYDQSVPAFARLKKNIGKAVERGYLIGLDKRRLYVRSPHRGLSQLLQSAAALVCKRWVQLIDQELKQFKGNAYFLGWIHDEVQIACKTKEIAANVGDITGRMAQEAGTSFSLKIPIASEFTTGRTWADTH
jgi:DNA polymerase I